MAFLHVEWAKYVAAASQEQAPLMRYPVVLLDVGETLVGPRESFGAVYSRVLASLGLDLEVELVERHMRVVWDEMERIVPRGSDRYAHFPGGEDEYWFRFAKGTIESAAGRAMTDRFVSDALELLGRAFREAEAWTVYADVLPTLRELRAAGARLGVVSNWDSRLPRLLDDLDLAPFFEAVGVSHLEGVEKPDPALFHRVLDRMGASPGQAIHVGDLPAADLEGARAAGLDAVLIDRRGKLGEEFPAMKDLRPLPGLIRGEGRNWPVHPASAG